MTKVSDRKEQKESPHAIVENAPVPSDSAPPAAAQPEPSVKQEKVVEELSVRKSEASENGENDNSDEIDDSNESESTKKIQEKVFEIWTANGLEGGDTPLPVSKAKNALE